FAERIGERAFGRQLAYACRAAGDVPAAQRHDQPAAGDGRIAVDVGFETAGERGSRECGEVLEIGDSDPAVATDLSGLDAEVAHVGLGAGPASDDARDSDAAGRSRAGACRQGERCAGEVAFGVEAYIERPTIELGLGVNLQPARLH